MNEFASRHIGINAEDLEKMLKVTGNASLEELISETIPADILLPEPLDIEPAMTEGQFAEHIDMLAGENKIFTSYIGEGWYDTFTPAVIRRNVFENPSWYTSYTPYQAEISQGRLEALLNFQTVITELTGLPLANASLLDEATAASEAANMMFSLRDRAAEQRGANILFVDRGIFKHSLAVLRTHCSPLDIEIEIGDFAVFTPSDKHFGAIVQLPNAEGNVFDYEHFISKMHQAGIKVAVGADILSLCLLKSPGAMGADIAFGSTQRFGIPMGNGGPYAAFFATKDEFRRNIPGRIIGVSKDKNGKLAYRMALQTREQHIKREKATSNICTASALMAIMSGFYAVYHGYDGLKKIASRVHGIAAYLSDALSVYGYKQLNSNYFDTLRFVLPASVSVDSIKALALEYDVNLKYINKTTIGISIDETTDYDDVDVLIDIFASAAGNNPAFTSFENFSSICELKDELLRGDKFLQHAVFCKYHTETEMMRYIKKLERRDISLTHSMIPLGSCTMKLNAASEMFAAGMPGFAGLHPFAPQYQASGFNEMASNLMKMLCTITGFDACSLQPNSGAAGEYAGLRIIREFFAAGGAAGGAGAVAGGARNTLLIPSSAHGTNPASAAQAGFDIVTVSCDENGNVELADWAAKASEYSDVLAGCMITYPSTHGIFEKSIRQMCEIIHSNGGKVYMDGANMNAQVGLTSPAFIGADVCHLNLHKTFAMPHGGGGPGSGPICCTSELAPFLPGHVYDESGAGDGSDVKQSFERGGFEDEKITVSAAPYGNALILPISYGYICMLGADGMKASTEYAILNANYLAARLDKYFPVLYRGDNGRVGHEVIVDCRGFKAAGITETDIAKRLMDFGFHAPTLSFPVHGTLMIEPTESESLAELDRFAEAMICIYNEINEIVTGVFDINDNVLVNAPHPEYELTGDEWKHSYSRQKAGYPLEWVKENKFMIGVGRVDNAWGDRNLFCTCL